MPTGKVLAFGSFDLLHEGHLFYLKKAKALGSELTVVIARDESVKREKGHAPMKSEKERLAIVKELKPVDCALLGSVKPELKFKVFVKEDPDAVALGHDHLITAKEVRDKLKEYGLKARVVRMPAFKPKKLKSSKIRKRVDLNLDEMF